MGAFSAIWRLRRALLLAGLVQAFGAGAAIPSASAAECTIAGTAPMLVNCTDPGIDTVNGPMSPYLDNDGDIVVTVTGTGEVIGYGLVVGALNAPHAIQVINDGLIEGDVSDVTSGALEIAGNGGAIRYSGLGVVRNLNGSGNGIYATNTAGGTINIDIAGTVAAGQNGYAVAAAADQGAVRLSTGAGLIIGGVGLLGTSSGTVSIVNRATIQTQYAGIVAGACGCGPGETIAITSHGDITVSDPAGYGIVAADASAITIDVLAGTIVANTGIAISTPAGTIANILVAEGATINAGNVGIDGQSGQSNITVVGSISGIGTAAMYLGTLDDTVTLHGTARVTGTVYAGIGADIDMLQLGGDVAGLFDLDQLDPGTGQFVGFDIVRKVGASTWTVVDSGGFYAGTIAVDQGKLRVDTAIGGLTAEIGAAGILGGTGALGGFVANGTVAPGNSIGTLTVGTAQFNTGSTFAIEIDPLQADRLGATDTILNGGTVAVTAALGSYDPVRDYTILTSVNPIAYAPGFAGISINSGLLDPALVQSGNDIVLRVTRVPIASRGLTPNQRETGRALDAFGTGAPHYAALFGLSAAQLPAALDMLSGEVHATSRNALLNQGGLLRDTLLDRLDSAFEAVPATAPMGYFGNPAAAHQPEQNLWATAYGMTGIINSDGNAASTDHRIGGLAAGLDGLIGPWRAGLMASYGHGGLVTRSATADIDSASIGVYAGTEIDDTRISLGALYTGHALATRRTVTLPGVNETLTAAYGGGLGQVFARVSHGVDFGAYEIEPFAELAYADLVTDGFSETGGAAALSVEPASTEALTTTIGLGGEADMALAGGILATFKGSAGWRHTFADQAIASNGFAGGGSFAIAGPNPSGGALAISAGILLDLSAAARLNLVYDGQVSASGFSHAAKAGLSGQF